ncbi:hypothetical protein AGMMS49992_18110 [Clostridia bacterium]|nr:hypothetical protein AGMMS49992_18110 [Clostridia bacterium]
MPTIYRLEDLPLFKDQWGEQWQVDKLLGQGSFSQVYKILRRNANIRSSVNQAAIKWLPIPHDPDEARRRLDDGEDLSELDRQYHEAHEKAAREILFMDLLRDEQHVLTYQNYGTAQRQGSLYRDILIQMELLSSLTKAFDGRAVTERETIKIGLDICQALGACHKNNIVHRDIKLDNIFVSDRDSYKLGDFGRAILSTDDQAGIANGNLEYMAPDVHKTGCYDEKSDQYAMGLVLYRLLNAEKREPFADDVTSSVTSADRRKAAQLKRLNGEILPRPTRCNTALWSVIQKACAPNPDNRYSSIMDMRSAIIHASEQKTPISPVDSNAVTIIQKEIIPTNNDEIIIVKTDKQKRKIGYLNFSKIVKLVTNKHNSLVLSPICLVISMLLFLTGYSVSRPGILNVRVISAFEVMVDLPQGVKSGMVSIQAEGNKHKEYASGDGSVPLTNLVPEASYIIAYQAGSDAPKTAHIKTEYPDAWHEAYATLGEASLLFFDASLLNRYSFDYVLANGDLLTIPIKDGEIQLRNQPTKSMQERYCLTLGIETLDDGDHLSSIIYRLTIKFTGGSAYSVSNDWTWPISRKRFTFVADLTPLLDSIWLDRESWPDEKAELSLFFDGKLVRTIDVTFTHPSEKQDNPFV